jgi:rhodanese-related sulfurtransferase
MGMHAIVIDVREPSEFATGHIAGAQLVPLSTLPDACSSWDRDQPMMLVCLGGRRAEKAMHLLRRKGFSSVSVLAGGMEAWRAAGKPVIVPQGAN